MPCSFVIIAADSSVGRSIITYKHDEDKVRLSLLLTVLCWIVCSGCVGCVSTRFTATAGHSKQPSKQAPSRHSTQCTQISLVGKNKLMAGAGPAADRVYFSEYISKNVALTEMRHGFPLDTASTAAYIRNQVMCACTQTLNYCAHPPHPWFGCLLTFVHYQLAIALRKGPYQVNLLIGGFDATPKAADEGGDAATTAADGSATDSKDDVVAGEPSL